MKMKQTPGGTTPRKATPPQAKNEAATGRAAAISTGTSDLRKAPSQLRQKLQKENDQPSRLWYGILLAAGILILGGTSAFAFGGKMPGWEQSLFVHINGVAAPHWLGSQLARPLSNAVWGIVALVVVFFCIPKYRLWAWRYGAAAGSSYAAAFVVEHIIDRGRPAVLYAHTILRANQDGAGFPSGHVSVLTALCLMVWPLVGWPWRVLLVLFVLAECWARVFLGVHAPLDVVGAVGVGMIVVGGMHVVPQRLRSFFRL